MHLPNKSSFAKSYINKLLSFFLLIIFFIFVNSKTSFYRVGAASLYLNPATGSILTPTFELTVSLDTEQHSDIKSVDTYIVFNNQLVSVEKIDKIGLTNQSTATYNNSTGIIHIKGDFLQTPSASNIINYSKIYFKALNGSKGSTANFEIDKIVNKSGVYNNSNTNLLNQTNGSNLLINTTSTIGSESTVNQVPNTGDNSYFMLLTTFAISSLSILILRKNAISKL